MPHVYRSQNLILIQINTNENSKTCKMDPYFFYHQLYAFFFSLLIIPCLRKKLKLYTVLGQIKICLAQYTISCVDSKEGGKNRVALTAFHVILQISILLFFFYFYFLQQQSFSKQIENFVGKTFTHTTYISVLPCHQSTIHSSLFSLQKTWLALQVIFNIYVHCVPMTQYHIFCFSLHFSILLMFFL